MVLEKTLPQLGFRNEIHTLHKILYSLADIIDALLNYT